MAAYLRDVQVGDQLIITNKLGLALVRGRRKDGSQFWYVPNRVQKTGAGDVEKYFGLVQVSDPAAKLLTLHITPTMATWSTHQYDTDRGFPGVVHYSALRVVVRLSNIHLAPHEETDIRRTGQGPRPTTKGIGTGFKPYRTKERLLIQ